MTAMNMTSEIAPYTADCRQWLGELKTLSPSAAQGCRGGQLRHFALLLDLAIQMLKDPYKFDLLSLTKEQTEREMEPEPLCCPYWLGRLLVPTLIP